MAASRGPRAAPSRGARAGELPLLSAPLQPLDLGHIPLTYVGLATGCGDGHQARSGPPAGCN